jgi:thioredoxin-related protein
MSILLCTAAFGNDYKQFAKDMNYELEYAVALQKAQEQEKDIMLVMVANFCPWCTKFEKLVLAKNTIDQLVHEKYIPLILNREEGNFPKKYDAAMIPTIYFVDYKGEVIKDKVVGYNNRQDFINIIKK